MQFSPSVYEHAAQIIKKSPWVVSRDSDLLYKAHAAAYTRYRHSPVSVGIDIYNLEAEAYGAVVEEPSGNNIPTISKPLLSTAEEIMALKPLDPGSDGRLSMVILTGEKLSRTFPDADVRIPVSGPVSIAGTLMGVEDFLMGLALDPEKVQQALIHLAAGQVAFCREIHRKGLDITFFESAAAPPLISPNQFREMILPVLKSMMEEIAEIVGHSLAFVIGGDTTPILDSLLQTETNYLICPSETDQEAFMKKIWDRNDITVRVNMDPRILVFGTWNEIKAEVDRILSITRGRENVCLGTGVLPYETPPENVDKVREYVADRN
ncbi:MAG: hypothetical protein GXO75_20255 [Calditrichaeota bacterium]|nr:hypothetical protein [Calditrichota bacterium]